MDTGRRGRFKQQTDPDPAHAFSLHCQPVHCSACHGPISLSPVTDKQSTRFLSSCRISRSPISHHKPVRSKYLHYTSKMTDENIGSTVHRAFIALHSMLCTLAVFVSVSSAIVADHWKDNIDGCILYANVGRVKNTSEWSMTGSSMSACNFVIFTPVFFIFICCLAISFHLRHLFCQRCWRAEEGKEDFWAMLVRVLIALCGFMALLSLIVACMLIHGHDITCTGIRNYVTDQGFTPWLGISAENIHELFARIDCGFYYSALDYGLKIGGSNETTIINSNAALEIAIVCAWFQFIFWVGTTAANVWLANKMKVELTFELPRLPACLSKE